MWLGYIRKGSFPLGLDRVSVVTKYLTVLGDREGKLSIFKNQAQSKKYFLRANLIKKYMNIQGVSHKN